VTLSFVPGSDAYQQVVLVYFLPFVAIHEIVKVATPKIYFASKAIGA
jgi:hypothetical protein